MKHCLQCGTVATNSETKCENCGFTKFTAPTSQTWGDMQIKINAQADRIAELEAALLSLRIYINNPSAWERYDDTVSEAMRTALKSTGLLEDK